MKASLTMHIVSLQDIVMKILNFLPACLFLLCAGTVFSSDIWEDRFQVVKCEIIYGPSPVGQNHRKNSSNLGKLMEQIRVVYTLAPEKPNIAYQVQSVVRISIFFGEQELIVPKELFTDYPDVKLGNCIGMRNGGFGLRFYAADEKDKGLKKGVPMEIRMDVQNADTNPVFRIVSVEDVEQSPIEKYARLFPVVAKK